MNVGRHGSSSCFLVSLCMQLCSYGSHTGSPKKVIEMGRGQPLANESKHQTGEDVGVNSIALRSVIMASVASTTSG